MSTPKNSDPTPARDSTSSFEGAVLLSDEIKKRCQEEPRLIEPFNDDNEHLKPASYHLSIGEQVRIDGVDYTLSADNPVQEIPPHGIAMIRTFERLNLPKDLIARWNIKVKEVYYGLVWVGGPQVDPGYHGPLICPVFNLSTQPYKLEYKKPLFTIDFVKTTPFISGESKELDIERKSESIGALDKNKTKSAIKERLEAMEQDIEKLAAKFQRFQEWSMALIVIIIAIIAVLATFGAGSIDWSKIDPVGTTLVGVSIGLSTIAIILVFWKTRKSK